MERQEPPMLFHDDQQQSHLILAPWDPIYLQEQQQLAVPILIGQELLKMSMDEYEKQDDTGEVDDELVVLPPPSRTTSLDLAKLSASCNSTRNLIFVDEEEDDYEKKDYVDDDLLQSWSSLASIDAGQDDSDCRSLDSILDMDLSQVTGPFRPTSRPYAQLVFDPDQHTLVALLEVSLAAVGRIGVDSMNAVPSSPKRLRMIELTSTDVKSKDPIDDLNVSAGTASTASIQSYDEDCSIIPFASFRNDIQTDDAQYSQCGYPSNTFHAQPVVFATESDPNAWLEDALDLYLLHDNQDPWQDDSNSNGGCSEALRKLLQASRSLVVFRCAQNDSPEEWRNTEPFSGIGYSSLLEI